jgi:hypothetical protein
MSQDAKQRPGNVLKAQRWEHLFQQHTRNVSAKIKYGLGFYFASWLITCERGGVQRAPQGTEKVPPGPRSPRPMPNGNAIQFGSSGIMAFCIWHMMACGGPIILPARYHHWPLAAGIAFVSSSLVSQPGPFLVFVLLVQIEPQKKRLYTYELTTSN